MRLLTMECNAPALDSFGPQDDAERLAQLFEDRPLLNVQLQICGDVPALAVGIADALHIDTADLQRRFQRRSVAVCAFAVSFNGMSAGECRRAKKAAPKTCSFFISPVHQPHCAWRPAVVLFRKACEHF